MTAEFDPTVFETIKLSLFAEDENEEELDQGQKDHENEPDAQNNESSYWNRKHATIFVIDCSYNLEKKLPEKIFSYTPVLKRDHIDRFYFNSQTTLPFEGCLWKETIDAIVNYMKGAIIANQFDKVGVVLFGVNTDELSDDIIGQSTFPGIYTLIDLDFVSAKSIRKLAALSNLTWLDFTNTYMSNQNDNQSYFKLSDLFWYLSQLFNRKTTKRQYMNRTFIITGNDNPLLPKEEKVAAIQRGKDLQQDCSDLECIPLQIPDREGAFDFNVFYAQVLKPLDKSFVSHIAESGGIPLSSLSNYIRRKEVAQRTLFQLPFHLAEGIVIGMEVYSSILKQRVPPTYFLDAETNKPLKTQTNWICSDTGQLLASTQIKRYIEYGESRVYITKQDKNRITEIQKPSENNNTVISSDTFQNSPHLELLGFKDISKLKYQHILKHANFLYPNDIKPPFGVQGSSALLAALITNMSKKNVFAVARFARRSGVSPRLCALLPQFEEIDETTWTQVTPPGLHLIPLPFQNEIRHIDLPNVPLSEQEGLTLENFSPYDVPDPTLQFHYAGLEAFALGEREPRCISDITNIDPLGLDEANGAAEEWLNHLETEFGKMKEQKTSIKKASVKRGITDVNKDDILKVINHHAVGSLNKLLVTELKGYLSQQSLPVGYNNVSGTKAVLIKRIEDHINKNQKEESQTKDTNILQKKRRI